MSGQEIYIGAPPVAPGKPRRKRLGRGRIIAISLVGVAVLGVLAAIGGYVAMGLISGRHVTITGTMDLKDKETAEAGCIGKGGYSDIGPGAGIVITDSTGKTIAVGRLNAGSKVLWDTCRFPFTIKDVPASDFYGIEVTHRGKVQYSRADVGSTIRLTLGD